MLHIEKAWGPPPPTAQCFGSRNNALTFLAFVPFFFSFWRSLKVCQNFLLPRSQKGILFARGNTKAALLLRAMGLKIICSGRSCHLGHVRHAAPEKGHCCPWSGFLCCENQPFSNLIFQNVKREYVSPAMRKECLLHFFGARKRPLCGLERCDAIWTISFSQHIVVTAGWQLIYTCVCAQQQSNVGPFVAAREWH